jgi:hypothetical protein
MEMIAQAESQFIAGRKDSGSTIDQLEYEFIRLIAEMKSQTPAMLSGERLLLHFKAFFACEFMRLEMQGSKPDAAWFMEELERLATKYGLVVLDTNRNTLFDGFE